MNTEKWLAMLHQYRAIAILRAPSFEVGLAMAKAVVLGGFRLIEVTWNSDRPAKLVSCLRQRLPANCCVGAGTLLSCPDLEEAMTAGAQFCFTPHTDVRLIQLAQNQAVPIIPGALTPTEITLAWQAGASGVKVFPSQALGGPTYIRHL
ncbi:MAG: ketohydroxyglutarate aldolase, partial [Leptolyngbya sp. SIO1D8]|nr:ketohydroxyglutarate aldolase [Leptolyngbya sp. SIO1D8]